MEAKQQEKNFTNSIVTDPCVVFRLRGNVPQRAGMVKYTRLAWYNALTRETWVIVVVDPAIMQTAALRRGQFTTLKVYYSSHGLGDGFYFTYHESGAMHDEKSKTALPLKK